MLADDILGLLWRAADGESFEYSDLGIWAEAPFCLNSESRLGYRHWKNGGVLDEKRFFASAEAIRTIASDYCRGDWEFFRDFPEEVAEYVFEEIVAQLDNL